MTQIFVKYVLINVPYLFPQLIFSSYNLIHYTQTYGLLVFKLANYKLDNITKKKRLLLLDRHC
jgi:hypothetical protein